MKTKLVIGILAAALLLCQGLAFAESADDVIAVAEDVVVTDPATGAVTDEAVIAEELVTPVAANATAVATKAKEEAM